MAIRISEALSKAVLDDAIAAMNRRHEERMASDPEYRAAEAERCREWERVFALPAQEREGETMAMPKGPLTAEQEAEVDKILKAPLPVFLARQVSVDLQGAVLSNKGAQTVKLPRWPTTHVYSGDPATLPEDKSMESMLFEVKPLADECCPRCAMTYQEHVERLTGAYTGLRYGSACSEAFHQRPNYWSNAARDVKPLTAESLLAEIRKIQVMTGKRVTSRPTKAIYQPERTDGQALIEDEFDTTEMKARLRAKLDQAFLASSPVFGGNSQIGKVGEMMPYRYVEWGFPAFDLDLPFTDEQIERQRIEIDAFHASWGPVVDAIGGAGLIEHATDRYGAYGWPPRPVAAPGHDDYFLAPMQPKPKKVAAPPNLSMRWACACGTRNFRHLDRCLCGNPRPQDG